MLVLGHMGYSSKYPPNTILAFKKAIEYGADGVELDVWLTKDSQVIVSHDGNLRKTAGVDISVKKSTYHEILNYDIEGEKLPLLSEVYDALPNDAIIDVEIKDINAVEAALRIAMEHDALDRTLFSAFNLKALKRLRKLSEDARIGILVSDITKISSIPREIYSLKAYYLNVPHRISNLGKLSTRGLIRFYRFFGVRIGIWTPNSPNDLRLFEGLYEMIITDEVERMVKYREMKSK